MCIALAAAVISIGQRTTHLKTSVIPPTTENWAAFVKRDPNGVRDILRQAKDNTIPRGKLSGLASGQSLDNLIERARQQRGAGRFTFDRSLLIRRETATEGVRDFGTLSMESSPTTAVTGNTWKTGQISASLTGNQNSPFKLEYLAVKYWKSGFGDVIRSEKSKSPFESAAEEGDSYQISVRVDPQKSAPGIYSESLKIVTPDATRIIPLKVVIIGAKQEIAVTEVLTPGLSFAAGEQRSMRFKLKNTGSVNFPYLARLEGSWNGLKSKQAAGTLVPGQTEIIDVPIISGTTTVDGNAGQSIEILNSKTNSGGAKVLFNVDIKTIWKAWSYTLESPNQKVVLNATVSVASSGIWVWRFNLRDKSTLTPDGNEMAFCFQNPIGGKRLGFYFKAYTKASSSIGLVYSGVDARLQEAFSSLGNMNVILNSWDVVTTDPFFKVIEYEVIANVSGPGALLTMALDPITDPTKPFTDWTASNNIGWLKLTGADVQ